MTALTAALRWLLAQSLLALPVMGAVLALRCRMRRTPKKYAFLLWAVVAFRLVVPAGVTRPVPWSLFNLRALEPVSRTADIMAQSASRDLSKLTGTATTGLPLGGMMPPPQGGETLSILALIWAAGMAALAIYAAVSYGRWKRSLSDACLQEEGVYEQVGLPTPFVLGFFRPKIYVPSGLSLEERACVLCHERVHIRRLDPWWKLLACSLCGVYWWNPGVWLCAALMNRDMEMSCDEAVLATMGPEAKRAYSMSLVSAASPRRFSAVSPLAFGETDAKRRVVHALNWKKQSPRVAFLAAAAVLLTAMVCCFGGSTSWVRAEMEGDGVAFQCALRAPLSSWALYEDIYQGGVLFSSVPRAVSGERADPALATDARDGGRLRVRVDYLESGFGGTLECWYGETLHWTTLLPKDYYVGAGGCLGQGENPGRTFRQKLNAGRGTILYSRFFSTRSDGGIFFDHAEEGSVGKNDTVVQYRLVASCDGGESFAAAAQTDPASWLFSLRNPYLGNAAADGALLDALGTGELGAYTMELFTAKHPYTLQVNFRDMPDDIDPTSPTIDRAMEGNGALLLALIDNLEQVNWTYPSREDGEECLITMYDPRQKADNWAENLGYADIKALGQSAEGVRALLAYLEER